ncbi:MAG: methylated-DNA--[protein]-cysteine S-methyltransferase [Planctomycetes bacterium]|nr:methylated-DNA--[protein]-cysteine S-methyltransferase [Planctomycetota bacterium]
MHNRLAVAYLDSPLGELGLAAGEHGLMAVSLGQGLESSLPALLGGRHDRGRGRHNPFELLEQACTQIVEYLLSAREKFELPLDLSSGTEFQRAVWRRLGKLRFGQATSYADLAEAVGRPGAMRAVGNAVGANPLPIVIPCHRVLAAGGRLGGFSSGLGRKRKLLKLEGIGWK